MHPQQNTVRRARPHLGTIVEITATGNDAAQAVDTAFQDIATVHRRMSFHETDSDVMRINCAPLLEPVHVAASTYEVLEFAYRLSLDSEGAFDVTVGSRLVETGFLPAPLHTETCVRNPSFRDMVLLPDNRVMRRRCVWIDLGGIAKGYAVDLAVSRLRSLHMQSGIVNAGGDLFVFGEPQPVHVRHPCDTTRFFPLGRLAECAIASSSGIYSGKFYEGQQVDPLFSSHENRCIRWQHGITVIAPNCMTADALTKVVRLAPHLATALLHTWNAQALIVDEEGIRYYQARTEILT